MYIENLVKRMEKGESYKNFSTTEQICVALVCGLEMPLGIKKIHDAIDRLNEKQIDAINEYIGSVLKSPARIAKAK